MKFLIYLPVLVASCLTLSNCGGGGDGDDSAPTVRPKTFDGLRLRFASATYFDFVRNSGSSAAVNSGDEETGTFFYTSNVGQVNLRFYDNAGGDQSNLWWPQSVAVATYSYRAVNETSGVLTLTGTGTIQDTFFSVNGVILNGSAIVPFVFGSDILDDPLSETKVVQIDLTFSSNGTSVATNTVTLSLPESTYVSTFDTVRIPTTLELSAGGFVSENYNPAVDPEAPSKIAPATLTDRRMTATNGIPDDTKNFSIQFVADAVQPSGSNGSEPSEVGQGLLRVGAGAGEVVTMALDYTWKRIGGTDTGELVLSNIPDNLLLPFDKSLNGSYILDFLGTENGIYTGSADGDTLDPADVSGTFLLLNGE